MVFLAVVALIWQWASQHPIAALVSIPSVVLGLWWLGKRERQRRLEVLDARLRDEYVPAMSPAQYEQFVGRRLEQAGWKVKPTGGVGDQGCDVLAEMRGFRCVIQCKRARAGNSAVQEVVAARHHYDAQVMAVVAMGFTEAARCLAASNGVHLLHHRELATLEKAARIP